MKDLVKVLYLGNPGAGKTTAMASALKSGSLAYVDIESGVQPRALRRAGITIPDGWEPTKPRTFQAVRDIVHALDAKCYKGEGPTSVAFDSASEFEAKAIKELRDRRADKANPEVWHTELGDFGDWTSQAYETWRNLRDLDSHVFIGALEQRKVNKNTGMMELLPDLTPKAGTALMAGMLTVIHLRVVERGGRQWRLGYAKHTDDGMRGKDNSALFPANGIMVEPTADRLIALVEDRLDLDDDPVTAEFKASK